MISIRSSEARGKANFGWLDSRHTFSFGDYYDQSHMGISALRVINDDRVAPGAGFSTHGHKDMEILSYVLDGEIAHKDSEGNVETLPAGEFQLMSAGSGIQHSEFNPSHSNPLHFLQIWILPNVYGKTPGYQQKHFGQEKGLTLVASPDGDAASLIVKQDARVYQLILDADSGTEMQVKKSRNYYVHLISGELALEGEVLQAGDGAHLREVEMLKMRAGNGPVKALVFDLP
jgi:redox-sensitive bicupin YhaK (pirin superfamily)